MRVVALAVFLSFPAVASAQTGPAHTATAKEKLEIRLRRVVSPMTLLGVATGAAIGQWRDIPEAWGQGMSGYGKRVGSGQAIAGIYQGIGLTSDLVFHLDPRYRPMPRASVKARIWNAISQEFLAYRDSGGRMINISTLGASYGSGFIANTWEPPLHNKASDALIRGTLSVAANTGGNVAREFLPDLWRYFRNRHKGQTSPNAPSRP
jgi:hypothetical protein